MVSERTRNELWNHVYDIERLCRYYEAIRDKRNRDVVIAQAFVLVIAAGVLIHAMSSIPMPWLGLALCLDFTAITVLLGNVRGSARESASARIVYEQLTMLRIDLHNLWLLVDDESADEADIRLIMDELARKVEVTTLQADLRVDKKLNKRTSAEAKQVLEGRYNIGAKSEGK